MGNFCLRRTVHDHSDHWCGLPLFQSEASVTSEVQRVHPNLALSEVDQAAIGVLTIKMMQGLLFSHFAKRGRGRPKKNAEVPRLIRGFKSMVKASGVAIDANEETVLLNQLLNKSLF